MAIPIVTVNRAMPGRPARSFTAWWALRAAAAARRPPSPRAAMIGALRSEKGRRGARCLAAGARGAAVKSCSSECSTGRGSRPAKPA